MSSMTRIALALLVTFLGTGCSVSRLNRSPRAAAPLARHVLPNGVRVVIQEHSSSEVVALQLWVKAGARDEAESELGLAHYLEHVLFKGTASRPRGFIDREVEGVGGRVNAGTSFDYTYYHVVLPAPRAVAGIELLADLSINASFDAEAVEGEKRVVLAEMPLSPAFPPDEAERERRLVMSQIQTRAETPFALALDALTAQLYGSHPLALPTLGRKASVERLGREDLIRHHRRVYRAGSIVLAVSGDVERESLRRHVQRLFARVPDGDVDGPASSEPTPSLERRALDRPTQQAQVLIGFLGPGIGGPDYAAGKIMSTVLGGGVAGRLFVKLREEQGLAYSLGMVDPARRNPASFVAYIVTSEHAVERAESGLRQEIERFPADGPSEAEVARAKSYVLGNLAMDRRTNARHAWYLALFELAGFGWDYPERCARALEAVSLLDVTRVARRYLANPTTVVVRPPS